MALVCKLELCLPHVDAARPATSPAYLFPCLLPASTTADLASHWPAPSPASAATSFASVASEAPPPAAVPVVRGHRFRAALGFLPPG
eukprot:4254054-Prymnesium_polylepis.1